MKVQYDATLDDLVDVSLRVLSRSRSFSPYGWAGNVGGAIFGGLLAGIGAYWAASSALEGRLLIAVVAGVIGAALFPFVRFCMIRGRLRRYYREMLGSDLPFLVQVELSPEGVCTKQKTGQVTFEWQQIESIRETPASIDIYARHGGMVVVRKRAFGSGEEMQRFVEEAQSLLTRARDLKEPQ